MKIFQPQYVIPTVFVTALILYCVFVDPNAGIALLIIFMLIATIAYSFAACITKSWAPWRHL